MLAYRVVIPYPVGDRTQDRLFVRDFDTLRMNRGNSSSIVENITDANHAVPEKCHRTVGGLKNGTNFHGAACHITARSLKRERVIADCVAARSQIIQLLQRLKRLKLPFFQVLLCLSEWRPYRKLVC